MHAQFSAQAPPLDKDTVPFTTLPSGVSYKEYKKGAGDATVDTGKVVSVQVSVPFCNP
jgi:hypothetical protein